MSTYKNPYPMPVQASRATAGTAVAVGWKIIFIKGDDGYVGHASEKELQDFVLHRFQDQDLSERCRLAVKSIAIFTMATELKL